MQGTLIQGLNEKIIQAKVNRIDVKPFLYATHFPLKKVNAFNWKTLSNQNMGVNIAADIVADNATSIRKTRPIFQSANGDLPRISISRQMTRSEIKEYQVALALAQDPMSVELVRYWSDDVEFCFTGVQSQLEYMAWAMLSNAGKLSFTRDNNAAVVTEFDLDYQVEDTQKLKNSVAWSNGNTADIIGDFKKAIEHGQKIGSNVKYGFVSLDTLYKIASSDQIIKASASYVQNLTGTSQAPDLTQINMMLSKQAWLNGVQLIVIDQTVTRELADGTRKYSNPFSNDICVFAETNVLGTTQYDILKENSQVMLRSERGHTVVKKYSTPEPLTEVTIGEADAIPVLDSAYKNIYMHIDAKDW